MITKSDTRPDDNYQEDKSEKEAGNGQLMDTSRSTDRQVISI